MCSAAFTIRLVRKTEITANIINFRTTHCIARELRDEVWSKALQVGVHNDEQLMACKEPFLTVEFCIPLTERLLIVMCVYGLLSEVNSLKQKNALKLDVLLERLFTLILYMQYYYLHLTKRNPTNLRSVSKSGRKDDR